MAESINDIAIKLSVDAAGVSRGFRTAAEEARMFKAEVDRLSYAVDKNEPQQYDAHVRGMQEQRTAAIKAQNDVQEEANRIIQQHMTLNERYAQQLARLTRLNNTTLVATGRQALSDSQLARAKTELTLSTIRQQQAQNSANRTLQQGADTTRVMTGVMAQASFAAEDFIQGIAFGDVRNALLGASNNLTMVVRGLVQAGTTAGGTSAALAGMVGWLVGIPVAAAGILAAFNWARYATQDVRSLSEALSDATLGLERFKSSASQMQSEIRFEARLRGVTTSESANEALLRIQDEQKINEREIQDIQRKANIEAQALIDNQLGGVEARIELERQIASTIAHGSREEIAAAIAVRDLMSEATEAARSGNGETVINDLRRIYELLNSGSLNDSFDWIGDLTSLDALEETFQNGYLLAGESLEKLREIREQLLATSVELNDADETRLRLLDEHIRMKEKEEQLLRQEKQLRQESTLFQLQATEAQKSEMDIRKQLMDFLGMNSTQPGQLDPTLLMGQSRQEAMDFLEAYNANLERSKQEMLDEQRQITPTGGMEQNAFAAQSSAMQQMLEAQYKQEDPQLRSIDTRIQQSNELLRLVTEGPGLVRIP